MMTRQPEMPMLRRKAISEYQFQLPCWDANLKCTFQMQSSHDPITSSDSFWLNALIVHLGMARWGHAGIVLIDYPEVVCCFFPNALAQGSCLVAPPNCLTIFKRTDESRTSRGRNADVSRTNRDRRFGC